MCCKRGRILPAFGPVAIFGLTQMVTLRVTDTALDVDLFEFNQPSDVASSWRKPEAAVVTQCGDINKLQRNAV